MSLRMGPPTQLELRDGQSHFRLYWGFFLEAADRLQPEFLISFCEDVIERVEPKGGASIVELVSGDKLEVWDEESEGVLRRREDSARALVPQWLCERWNIRAEPEAESAILEWFAFPVAQAFSSGLPEDWSLWWQDLAHMSPDWTGDYFRKKDELRAASRESLERLSRDRKAHVSIRIDSLSRLLLREMLPIYNPLVFGREEWLQAAHEHCERVERFACDLGAKSPRVSRGERRNPDIDRSTVERNAEWMVKRLLLNKPPSRIAREYDDQLESAGFELDEQPTERTVEKALRQQRKLMRLLPVVGRPKETYP